MDKYWTENPGPTEDWKDSIQYRLACNGIILDYEENFYNSIEDVKKYYNSIYHRPNAVYTVISVIQKASLPRLRYSRRKIGI